MKKLLALLLALVLLTSLFAGCAKNEEGENPQSSVSDNPEKSEGNAEGKEDLMQIEVFLPGDQVGESSLGTPVGDYIAENFGIEYVTYGFSGDEVEKQGLMLAGGDYGGLAAMNGATMTKNYIEAGALINLDDYKELLPDFYELFEEQIPFWRQEASDGGLYIWRLYAPKETITVFEVMVRSDVLEYYGWPEIITEQDWLEFLKQAMKDFPASFNGEPTVGMAANMADEWFRIGSVSEFYDKGERHFSMANEPWLYDLVDKKVIGWNENEDVKASLKWWHDLYQAGILDPECVTDTGDTVLAKMSDGRALAYYYGAWNLDSANQALVEAGHPEMQFIQLPIQTTRQVENNEGRAILTNLAGEAYHTRGVTVNCPDVEKFLKFLNWACTEEGQILLNNGFEGVHYTVDENGKRQPTERRIQMWTGELSTDEDDGLGAVNYWLPSPEAKMDDGQWYNMTHDTSITDEYSMTEREIEAYNALGYTSSTQWWDDNAIFYDGTRAWLAPTAQPLSDTDMGRDYAKLKETISKYTVMLIFSEDFEATWNEFMAEYNKIDWQSILDYMNAEIDRMATELGVE